MSIDLDVYYKKKKLEKKLHHNRQRHRSFFTQLITIIYTKARDSTPRSNRLVGMITRNVKRRIAF